MTDVFVDEVTAQVMASRLQTQLGTMYFVKTTRDPSCVPPLPPRNGWMAVFSIGYAGEERYLCTVFTGEQPIVEESEEQMLTWSINASMEVMDLFRSMRLH